MTSDDRQAESMDCDKAASREWTQVYDAFVARLRGLGIGGGAPRLGDAFPDLALPDDEGRFTTLSSLVARGPLVLSFNRGGWCPYCRAELAAWGGRLPELAAMHANFAAVVGEVGGRAGKLRDWVGGDATILCDVDHGAAFALGLAFHCGDDLQRRYVACGLDLASLYGGGGGLLPVPATFVLDRSCIVRFAFVEPDFRLRADPDQVIEVVRSLA